MASVVVISDTGERAPLLHSSPLPADEIVPLLSPSPTEPHESTSSPAPPPDHKKRLVSLDVLRGLSVARIEILILASCTAQENHHSPGATHHFSKLMILVDDAGGTFPSINHSPWFGVTIADFVMPLFLFSVGVSVGLVFKKVPSKLEATKKALLRTIKLFFLGLILQGGYFHGRNDLTYGVDLGKIRWMGVLQRISIGYLLTSVTQIWLVNSIEVDSGVAFAKKYYTQWVVAIILSLLYVSLLYGLYVPNWSFEVSRMNLTLGGSSTELVHCGERGSLEPPCNAVGLIDRLILGEQHLYKHPVYRRTQACSINSPDYGPLPANSPGWCLAPFDPEGLLSSLMAAVTCFMGLHFGHIILHFKNHLQRIILWSICSLTMLISGYILEVLGVPLSKPLYTLSYMCITTGASGILLTIIFYIVDVKCVKKPLLLFQWLGMNALIVYALAACDLFPAALQGFYWHSPENNLVNTTERLMQVALHSKKLGSLAFVILEILFWGLVAGFLHFKRIYVGI